MLSYPAQAGRFWHLMFAIARQLIDLLLIDAATEQAGSRTTAPTVKIVFI